MNICWLRLFGTSDLTFLILTGRYKVLRNIDLNTVASQCISFTHSLVWGKDCYNVQLFKRRINNTTNTIIPNSILDLASSMHVFISLGSDNFSYNS